MDDVPLPVVVLADALCGAADDLNLPLYRRDAERLADHTLDLLDVAGYRLTRQEDP